jgi:hypothetical protein
MSQAEFEPAALLSQKPHGHLHRCVANCFNNCVVFIDCFFNDAISCADCILDIVQDGRSVNLKEAIVD